MIFDILKKIITAAEELLLVIDFKLYKKARCFLNCMDTESELKITSVRNWQCSNCMEKVPVLRPFF